MKGKINIIFGATASGKTAYGIELAKKLDGEVINADSMQVYTEIPIITAQPSETEKDGIPHHLFGCVSVFEKYSVARYIDDVVPVIKDVLSRGKTPILVGGTGMYIKSLVEGIAEMPDVSEDIWAKVDAMTTDTAYLELSKLDPEVSSILKPGDSQRIKRALSIVLETGVSIKKFQESPRDIAFSREQYHIIWLKRDREFIYDRINKRFELMVQNGAIDEVRRVVDIAQGRVMPRANGLYEIRDFLLGNITLKEATTKTQQLSRNYAKRQNTWGAHQLEFDEVI